MKEAKKKKSKKIKVLKSLTVCRRGRRVHWWSFDVPRLFLHFKVTENVSRERTCAIDNVSRDFTFESTISRQIFRKYLLLCDRYAFLGLLSLRNALNFPFSSFFLSFSLSLFWGKLGCSRVDTKMRGNCCPETETDGWNETNYLLYFFIIRCHEFFCKIKRP